MDSRPIWHVGHATPPAPHPPSFAAPHGSMASPPPHHDPYPSGYFPDVSGGIYNPYQILRADGATAPDIRSTSQSNLTHVSTLPLDPTETRFYNMTPPNVAHQYRSPSALNSVTSIGAEIESNPNLNLANYSYSASDFDTNQYAFSSQHADGAPLTPSTLSEGTGYSTTPPDSGSPMSPQLVANTCRSNDPELRLLADALLNRRLSLAHESIPDLYVAQFFSIESVSGGTQPASNRRKRREKPRPKNMLAYHCLWCGHWVGYSKEKARQHFLIDLNMKGITCVKPGCGWKTARPSDFTRHMKLVHKMDLPKKKSGGAMQAGKPFLDLQKAYRDGARVFPVDVGQNSFPAMSDGLTAAHTQLVASHSQWIGAFPEFSNLNSSSPEFDQVRLKPSTFYGTRRHTALGYRLRWASTVFVVLVAANAGVYGVHIRKPAEPFRSIVLELTNPTQKGLFPWSPVISSVLGAKIMTLPAQNQNSENSKNITKRCPCLMTSSGESSCDSPDPSAHVLLSALSEPKRQGLHPGPYHLNEVSQTMFSYSFSASWYACTYVPLSTATIGNQRRGFQNLLSTASPPTPHPEVNHRRTLTGNPTIQPKPSSLKSIYHALSMQCV